MAHDATWSLDGQSLVYARGEELYLSRNDGTQAKRLATTPGRAHWIRWSPDGRHLRFTLIDSKGHRRSLWEASADGTDLRVLPFQWGEERPQECCARARSSERNYAEERDDRCRLQWTERDEGDPMTLEHSGLAAAANIDRDRVKQLTEEQQAKLTASTPTSGEYFERASKVMPGGVPSSFQQNKPWPVYIERGTGAQVWDVDGSEYIDFHNGFGVMCVGHANPKIAAAVKQQVDEGTHFAAPTEGSIVVAEELKRRFGLPQWRFTNSGTESTMDAVHLARGATGRDMLLKIEGSYHGHHDSVMVSVYPPIEALGERDDPVSVPYGAGYPRALTELTRAVPVQRRRRAGERARQARRQGRRPDHGAGDDEHQHRSAGRGLPAARARADQAARRDPDLRRGKDRGDDLRGRRDGSLRRAARRDRPCQGDLRRLPRRRDRHERRAGTAGRRRTPSTSTAPSTATRW